MIPSLKEIVQLAAFRCVMTCARLPFKVNRVPIPGPEPNGQTPRSFCQPSIYAAPDNYSHATVCRTRLMT
jgi:hypothetical protein